MLFVLKSSRQDFVFGRTEEVMELKLDEAVEIHHKGESIIVLSSSVKPFLLVTRIEETRVLTKISPGHFKMN